MHRTETSIWVGAGAKLFYLSGMRNGKYMKREVLNLARFISVMRFRPLKWRTTHPYLLVDRFEVRRHRSAMQADAGPFGNERKAAKYFLHEWMPVCAGCHACGAHKAGPHVRQGCDSVRLLARHQHQARCASAHRRSGRLRGERASHSCQLQSIAWSTCFWPRLPGLSCPACMSWPAQEVFIAAYPDLV